MTEAVNVQLDVTGAVLATPSDVLVVGFRRRLSEADVDKIKKHVQDVLGIPLLVLDDVTAMTVVTSRELHKAKQVVGGHDFSMPHKMLEDGVECPPNCPAVQEHKPPSYYDMAHAPFMQGPPPREEMTPQRLLTSAEYAEQVRNDVCRRCFRRSGTTTRPPCGSCPDYPEWLAANPQPGTSDE